jgi:hypothetical protein
MIQIKPIQLGLQKKEGVSINVKPINVELFTDSCGSYWQIFDADGNQVDEGNLDIPSEIYLNWKEDDNIIVDYVLVTLKLNRYE